MKKLRHTIELVAAKGLLLLLKLLPYRWAVAVGGGIGGLLWHIGVRRRVSRYNLHLCLPEFSWKDADRILIESYRNFCRSMVEFALLPRLMNRTLKYVEFDGLEPLINATGSGRGVLLVTGHFGSWELLGASLREAGLPSDFLVGEQTNRAVDELINGIRRKMGIGIINMGVAARGVFKAIKNGHAVAMLSDQDAGKSSTIVKFFGHPAATPSGIGAFALKLRCPIAVGGIVRTGRSPRHTVYVEIHQPDYDSMPPDKEEAIRYITQLYTDRIEDYIRRYPAMYFWAHRRFKSTITYPD